MESAFRVTASDPHRTRNYAPRYTSDEWEAIKPKIQQFYVQDEKTLQQVIDILQRDHGFVVSEKQLKSRIAKWGFDIKNIKGHTMVRMARARLRRKREDGKDSIFHVNSREVPDRNINRYLKRNKISEESLLSMASPIDAPSPVFRVSTPHPKPLSRLAKNTLDVADGLSCSNDSQHVDSGKWYSNPLPRSIQDRSESPEVLLWRFRDQICPMLSITGSQDNMWRDLVMPLVHNSQSLCLAISAFTARHISTNGTSNSQLHVHGTKLLLQSYQSLRSELVSKEHMIATFATIVLLAGWTGWSEGRLNYAKAHMKGATAMISQIASQLVQRPRGLSRNEGCALIFLVSTFEHISALSSIVHAALAKVLPYSTAAATESFYMHHEIFWNTVPLGYRFSDPWLDCLSTSIYLMKRAAQVCHEVVSGISASSAICQKATCLKQEIEGWTPTIDRPRSRTQLFTADEEYMLHTAEAYRYATLLYLHQAVPEMPSASSQQLAMEVIRYLCSCPPSSTFTFAQTYPLFVAGCEVTNQEDRQWVKEQWTIKMAHMRVPNISKCWEITQEVWKRRDAYGQTRRDSSVNDQPYSEFQTPGDAEYMDSQFSVKGNLHWAQIMREWDWEVSF